MKPTENEIENTLRNAPHPSPPPGLRDRLLPGIELNRAAEPSPAGGPALRPAWFQRWWPALGACGLALASTVLLTVQHSELATLQGQLAELKQAQAAAAAQAVEAARQTASASVPTVNGAAELERLRAAAGDLKAEIARLETLKAENARLAAAAAGQLGLSAEQLEQLQGAREKAQLIQCVNNLKQLGLAARLWSSDNGDVLPPDILSMSNYMGSPKILTCPADTGRQAAADWASCSLANVSYDFLAPNGTETEPLRVMFRCPTHGNVCLVDGSVQQRVAKDQPEKLVQRDGKLFMEDHPTSQAIQPGQLDPRMAARYGLGPAPGQAGMGPGQPGALPDQDHLVIVTNTPGVPQMDERLMRRYGLVPAGAATNEPPAVEESGNLDEPAPEPAP